MIGHYVLTFTPEQETRVLTRHMEPGGIKKCVGSLPCLMEVADDDETSMWMFWTSYRPRGWASPWVRYDDLCFRFGTERINTAIRNRILSNQARRLLKQDEVPVCM
jgi:hypothetical protein